MPASLTYPGVYVEEIPSGVRAITGVSTSVTAFVGAAKQGPLNRAVRVLGFADFERRFGGLADDSEMSYAVRQFFANGGSEAWIVRVAKNPSAASRALLRAAAAPTLNVTARDQGQAGNRISVAVDYRTDNPGSTFNLTVALLPEAEGEPPVIEAYRNLSLNSKDRRYAETTINDASELVTVKRVEPLPAALAARKGTSKSGVFPAATDFTTLIDATHKAINVALNGAPPVRVELDPVAANTLAALRAELAGKLTAKFGAGVAVTVDGTQLVVTSQATGEFSTVRILPGETLDAAARLLLGPAFGGTEEDAAAILRPLESPDHASVLGGVIGAPAELDNIPSAKKHLLVVLDGSASDIALDGVDVAGTVDVRLTAIAGRIEQQVRASRPAFPAFRDFHASVEGANRLRLESGTRGKDSSVEIRAVAGDGLADALKLTGLIARGADLMLEGGSEAPFEPTDAYGQFIGDRSKREGIFALEAVDIFNIMVLAGITDTGILSDASSYCLERRAFLIVDPPESADQPDEMEKTAAGTTLPKTKSGAVYYPWIKIADPLNGGRLRSVPPSGTIAGLYARTDSTRGVWKAPAGTEASLVGVQGVDYLLSDPETGVLNPRGVNCIRIFPNFGPVAWGARTLQGDDQMASEWKYVPVRRLALFLEESLFRGTKWAVFEPNDEPLWAQLRLNIGAFMHGLFRQGAFAGDKPRDAYFVKCDHETTTQTDVNLGIVNIVVGYAPLKPAEFVVLKFQQMAGQIQT